MYVKSKHAALLTLCLLLGISITAYAMVALDPIRQYINSDGSLRLRGSSSGAFLNYLQHGPSQTTQVRQIQIVDARGGTMAWRVETIIDAAGPQERVATANWQVRVPTASQLSTYILHPVRDAIGWFLSLFTGTASAACAGGTCYWIGGTGNFSDGAHWSTSSGGGTCTCIPGSAVDSVVFDASSGAGTATQDFAIFTSGAATMTNSTVRVAGGSNLWIVSGSWSNGNGKFDANTSVVKFIATGTLTNFAVTGCAVTTGAPEFYELWIYSGTVTQQNNGMAVIHALTVDGALRYAAASLNTYICNNQSIGVPFNVGGGGSVAGFNSSLDILYLTTFGGTVITVVAGTYTNMEIRMFPQNNVASDGVEYRLNGALTVGRLGFVCSASNPFFFNSQTFAVTLQDADFGINFINNAACAFGIKATSGAWSLSGGLNVPGAQAIGFYIQFGSTTWTVGGAWTNASTSASWSAGTGTMTFNSSANRDMAFAGAHISGNEFNNLTFDAAAASDPTYYLQNALTIGGTLVLKNTTGSPHATTLDVTGGNYKVTATTVSISSVGNTAILFGRQGTIKTKNWDSVSSNYLPDCFSTFVAGCVSNATVEFYGTGTISGKGSPGAIDFWNVTIDAGAVTTFIGKNPTTEVSFGFTAGNQITVNGTLIADGASPRYPLVAFITNGLTTSTPLVVGGAAVISDSGFFELVYGGNQASIPLPGGTYSAISLQIPYGTTVNQTGNVSTNPASCTVVSSSVGCEIIMATYSTGPFFDYYTNNYTLTSGGELVFGDVSLDGVNFHGGSSHIVAYGFAPIERSTIYLDASTVDAYPPISYSPVSWIQERQAVVHGGTSTVNIHGAFRLWPFPNVTGNNAGFLAESATVNVLADAQSGTCAVVFGATRCPGDVFVDEADYYIDFGSSIWNVSGNWKSVSTSAHWSQGSQDAPAIVRFNGTLTQTIANNGFPLPIIVLVSGTDKNFTQSFSDSGLVAIVAVRMTITAGITWSHSGASLTGADATHLLTLRSSVPGTRWNLNPIADRIAAFVDVQDSSSSKTIVVCDDASLNSGNNIEWAFQKPCPNLVITGEQMIGLMQLVLFVGGLVGILGLAIHVKMKRDGGL